MHLFWHLFSLKPLKANGTTIYVLVKEKQTWPKAQSYCRTHHTDLASIRSNGGKSNIALAFTGSGFTQTPIGLYRDPWTSWSDNSTSMFTNWGPSQPNNYLLQQSCTLINLDLWKWYDGECNSRFSFYCFKGEVLNTNTVVSRHYVLMLMFFILLLVVCVCVCNALNSIAVTNQTILKVKIQSEGNMNSAQIQQQVLQQESILSTMHIQLQLTLSIFLIWNIFSSWRPTCNQKDWQTSRYFGGVSKVTIRNANTGRRRDGTDELWPA